MRHFASKKSQKKSFLERDERAAVFVVFITVCRRYCARRLRRLRRRLRREKTFFIVAIEKNGRWEVDFADDWIGPQYNEGGGHVGSILFENDLDG